MFRTEGSELVKGSMLALTIDAILDFAGERSGHFRMIECEVSSHDAYGTPRELFVAFFGVIAGRCANCWGPTGRPRSMWRGGICLMRSRASLRKAKHRSKSRFRYFRWRETSRCTLANCSPRSFSVSSRRSRTAQVCGRSAYPPMLTARRLRGAVWYPCPSRQAWPISANSLPGVKDCPLPDKRLPLIVISHGRTAASGHHDTAEVLADAGFIVAAINHAGDTSSDLSRTDDLSIYVRGQMTSSA